MSDLADALNKVQAVPVDALSGALILDKVKLSPSQDGSIVATIDGESAIWDGQQWTRQ